MSERDTKQLLASWGRQGIPVEDPERAAERRPRVVAGVARAIRTQAAERSRRARRWRVVAALSAAAAVALVVLLSWPGRTNDARPAAIVAHGEGVTVAHGGTERSVAPAGSVRLESGDGIATSSRARAELTLDSGATVRLSESTTLKLDRVGRPPERVRIDVGAIAVTVPPLGPAGRFQVLTPDATVTVHGTAFDVSVVTRDGRSVTSVVVSEGVVEVEHRAGVVRLPRGASWSSLDVDDPEAPRPAPPVPTPSSVEPTSPVPAAPPPRTPKESKAPSVGTALAAQNRLFAAAVAARQGGNDARAVSLLDQLLAKHPDSPLAPEARVERFRALTRMGKKDEAAKEARRYLLEHGSGAARDEARDLAIPKK